MIVSTLYIYTDPRLHYHVHWKGHFFVQRQKTANEKGSSIHVGFETLVFFKILAKMGTLPYFFFVESSDILAFPKLKI